MLTGGTNLPMMMVLATKLHEFIMSSLLHNLPGFVQHHNMISVADSVELVSHDDNSVVSTKRVHGVGDDPLGDRIQGGCGFI